MQDRRKKIRRLYTGVLQDGKQVTDEICSCGHRRSEHADTLSLGHGQCLYPSCACQRFTWVCWVTDSIVTF